MSDDKDFAKLFTVDGAQVLVWREQDTESDEDEREQITQMTCVDGLEMKIAAGGLTYANSDKFFADYDMRRAKEFRESAIKLLGESRTTEDQA